MKKDYEGIFIDSKQSVVCSGPTNLFQQQINSMKEKRFLGVHQSAKELVSAFQDPDEYSKISIEKTPHKYKQLAGYCILVRDKSHFGLKPVLFNLPGNFTSQKPLLDKYLGYELENDPKMPSYITSSLGQRAIRELVPNNNVFAAVEFGKGLRWHKKQ
jgi:hypothetical protein